MTTPTIKITGSELAEIAAADITDQAAESAEAVKTIGAQNIDTVIADIGETGSAKIARNGDLLTRREENSDWLFCGTVEPEDRNDVLQALYDAGKLFGDWRPAE